MTKAMNTQARARHALRDQLRPTSLHAPRFFQRDDKEIAVAVLRRWDLSTAVARVARSCSSAAQPCNNARVDTASLPGSVCALWGRGGRPPWAILITS
jgi:hypothetical protein